MLDTYLRQKVDLVNFDSLEIILFHEELDRMDGTGWNLTGRDGEGGMGQDGILQDGMGCILVRDSEGCGSVLPKGFQM